MSVQIYARTTAGLEHYDHVLGLTGQQYRFTDGHLTVGVVLGPLDSRTGRLPIGLIDGRNAYWADLLYYDANRRTIDAYEPLQWSGFVGSYAGRSWLLGLIQGLGGLSLMIVGGVGSAVLDSMRFFLVPAILFGLVGLFVYGLVGYVVAQLAMQMLPYLVIGFLAWASLCTILSFERRRRCHRIAIALETLLERQLLPVFG